jgi:NET1-associated nuclear protein 1 (U3 small nucleolar RNA-associated protein 17)
VDASPFIAYHTEADGTTVAKELFIVLLSTTGEITLHPGRPGSATPASVVGRVPHGDALPDLLLSVGAETGVIAVGIQNSNEVRVWSPLSPGVYSPMKVVTVRVSVSSMAMHPSGFALAVGGVRGEIHVIRDVDNTGAGGFSDHWHHTPVTALLFSAGGHALLSGAGEGTICLWSLSDYSMTKLRTRLGALHGLVAAVDKPSIIAVPSGRGSLGLLDLVERRVTRQRDGVHWSAAHPCRGVVVTDWFGTRATVLTGLPDVLRVFDPVANDALHSLTATPNLETVRRPPTVGITQVAVLRRGWLLVTYEEAADLALPSVLRWWKWNPKAREFAEDQCVYAPHGEEPISAILALGTDAIITLSPTSAKCWSAVTDVEAKRAAAAGTVLVKAEVAASKRLKMHCVSSARPTAGKRFTAMTLTADGEVLFVAEEDCIIALDVSNASASRATWPRVITLQQPFTAEPITYLEMADATTLVATTATMVLSLPLIPNAEPRVLHQSVRVLAAAVVHGSSQVFVVAAADGQAAISVIDAVTGEKKGSALSSATDVVACAGFDADTMVVVSRSRGLRLVRVPSEQKADVADEVVQAPLPSATGASTLPAEIAKAKPASARGLSAFFRAAVSVSGEKVSAEDAAAAQAALQRKAAAQRWLTQVVGQGEAYTAPAATTVLDGYLAALLIQPPELGVT